MITALDLIKLSDFWFAIKMAFTFFIYLHISTTVHNCKKRKKNELPNNVKIKQLRSTYQLETALVVAIIVRVGNFCFLFLPFWFSVCFVCATLLIFCS